MEGASAVDFEGDEPEETLEVAGDEDVHCGTVGFFDADCGVLGVASAAEEAV